MSEEERKAAAALLASGPRKRKRITLRVCDICGQEFQAQHALAKYCSPAHAMQAYRKRRKLAEALGVEPDALMEHQRVGGA